MTTQLSGALLLDPAVVDDPYPFYRELRAHAPVWEVPGTGIFTVSTVELINEAVGRTEDFSSNMKCLLYRDDAGQPCRMPFGVSGAQALASADPPVHTLHRSTVFPELIAKRMDALEPDIDSLAGECVTRALESGGTTEFMTAVANVIPITITSRLIGFRGADMDQLLSAAFDGTALVGVMLTLDELMPLVTRSAEIQEWIDGQVATSREAPGADLLGTLATAVNNEVFSATQAASILHILLSAGGESTTSLLGNAVRLLAEQPELQARLRADPGLIPRFAEEVLRLESPFRYQMRSVPRDTVLGGVSIPADSTVLLLFSAANRDTAEFDRPDEVDLQRRQPRQHLAFGRGIHYCVGAPLARVEARIVLSVLLERTSSIALDPARPPRWVKSLMVRRHQELPLRLEPRS
jgi:cytochrome P450 family 144